MALTHIIKDLLYLNDKLVIPGFGGFVAQHTSAQIPTGKNIITAPGKYFIFDSALKEDDGILVQYISRLKSVTLQEAAGQVNDMVNGFMKKLDQGNTLVINQVGYFVKDEKGVIRFKRDEDQNFHPESFGLSPVGIRLPSVEPELSEDVFVPEKRKSRLVRILVIFLALNAIGALSAVIYWKFGEIKSFFHPSPEKTTVPVVLDTVQHQKTPDTSALGQYIDTSTNIKNALRYEEAQKTARNSVKTDTEKTFYIIAGSFQSYPKAELFAKTLKKSGFTPEVIEFSQDLFRISVGEYKNREEALKQLETVKSKKGTEQAWLLAK